MNKFVSLHCHSSGSFLDGYATVDEMSKRASELSGAVGLTDHGECNQHVAFMKACAKHSVKGILGTEAYLVDSASRVKAEKDRVNSHLCIFAENQQGLSNLWTASTVAYKQKYFKPLLDWESLGKIKDGLIVTDGCLLANMARYIVADKYDEARAWASQYLKMFGDKNFFMELHTFQLIHPTDERELKLNADMTKMNQGKVQLAKELGIPLIVVNDAHYAEEKDWENHQLVWQLSTNQEKTSDQTEAGKAASWIMNDDEVYHWMSKHGISHSVVEEAINNTALIADRCDVEIKSTRHIPLLSGKKERDLELFEKSIEDGFKRKVVDKGLDVDVYAERVGEELDLIVSKDFYGYFNVVADYCKYAKSQGWLVGPARGSAGGSLVAYLMDITEVDPLKYNLMFARFISPGRKDYPDIDLDFPQSKRGQVKEYLAYRFGEENVASIGTLTRSGPKGLLRDLCRAMRIDFGDMERMSKIVNQVKNLESDDEDDEVPWDEVIAEKGGDLAQWNEKYPRLFNKLQEMLGLIRQSSTHAAGVLISDESLMGIMPMRTDKEGNLVTQFEAPEVEELGFIKFDILGIRHLDTLMEAERLISGGSKPNPNRFYNMGDTEYTDQSVWDEITAGNTMGLSQLETNGMTVVGRRLAPHDERDIATLISINRPGVIDAGMLDEYLDRRNGLKSVIYPHPLMEEVLKPTFGVCVASNSRVIDGTTGMPLALGNVKEGMFIQGVNKDNGPALGKVTKWIDSGIKNTFRVSLKNGAKIDLTSDHKMLTEKGWVPLLDLSIGDYVATPKELLGEFSGITPWKPERARILGYLLADGAITQETSFVNVDQEMLEEYARCVTQEFPDVLLSKRIQIRNVTRITALKSKSSSSSYHTPNDLTAWLRTIGLKWKSIPPLRVNGCGSENKFIPNEAFGMNRIGIQTLLAALWDCDGTVVRHGKREYVSYKTISERLAADIQTLLLRLGISSTIYSRPYQNPDSGWQTAYQVSVYSGTLFGKLIQPYMIHPLKRIVVLSNDEGDSFVEKAPFLHMIKTTLREQGYSIKGLVKDTGIGFGNFLWHNSPRVKQTTVRSMIQYLGIEELSYLMNTQWNQIVSIEYVGQQAVCDITVEGLHSFTANNITVHNCVYQEQAMKLSQILAGYTAEQAEVLRKAMGKKLESVMTAEKPKFIQGCLNNPAFTDVVDNPKAIAENIWHQLSAAQRYSFNQAHAQGYALICTWGAYLKQKYPSEYITACMQTDPKNVNKYIREARRLKIPILPPDINESGPRFRLTRSGIRYGLETIDHVGSAATKEIMQMRPFTSLEDFLERTSKRACTSAVVANLICVGAMDSIGDRTQMLQHLYTVRKVKDKVVPDFSDEDVVLAQEMSLLGAFVTRDPADKYRRQIDRQVTLTPDEVDVLKPEEYAFVGGQITKLHELDTKKGDRMAFMDLSWDDKTYNVTIFPRAFSANQRFLEMNTFGICRVQKLEKGVHMLDFSRLDNW